MCGIAGALAATPQPWITALVDSIVRDQLARGPDHQATMEVPLENATCMLGHDRLSIIDLSAGGNQPMWDRERRYCLTYNGEIYNYIELRAELVALGHEFQTQSDSEVIIAAFRRWGEDAVPRFNGMFAFALADVQTRTLWLFRDRFGVKPLYYRLTRESLAFASTSRALAKHFKLAPNLEYVSRGLTYWVYEDSSDRTQYVGLNSVQPGHLLRVRVNGGQLDATHRRYYDLEARVEETVKSMAGQGEPILAKRVLTTLSEAVALRMRADVPVGVSVSGGLDSSSIVGLLARQPHAGVRGFSFADPGDSRSEGPQVAEISRLTGVPVEYVWPTAKELAASLSDVIEAQDAPFPSGSIVAQYWVYKRARALGFKVLMGGQGGDEAFMGYRKYQFFGLQSLRHQRSYRGFLAAAAWLLPLLVAEAFQVPKYWRNRHRYLRSAQHRPDVTLPPAPALRLGYDPMDSLTHRQALDITDFSLPTLLRYEDRNSMASSIESRLPFMDYRLVELGLALPLSMKIRRGYGKWVVRDVASGFVPESIRRARFKVGFAVHEHAWIDAGMGDAIRHALKDVGPRVAPFLSTPSIDVTFSNAALKRRSGALGEAISLIWIGRRAS